MRFLAAMSDVSLSEVERRAASEAEAFVPMDEETFRAFYERTSRAVWAYLSRLTGDRQLADDLLQETYYRFLRARITYESETHRRNSLFCIATNVARDVIRRRQRHGLSRPLPEDGLPTLDGVAERAEGRTDLARAMTHLTPLQREMLWLAYGQGSSHAEIAEIVGLKAGSVKLLLFRARRKLAALLRGKAS